MLKQDVMIDFPDYRCDLKCVFCGVRHFSDQVFLLYFLQYCHSCDICIIIPDVLIIFLPPFSDSR